MLDIPNRDHMRAVGDKVYKAGVLAFLSRRRLNGRAIRPRRQNAVIAAISTTKVATHAMPRAVAVVRSRYHGADEGVAEHREASPWPRAG